jgi:hypothetical protein
MVQTLKPKSTSVKKVLAAPAAQAQYVFQIVLADLGGKELLLGRDCVRLTKKYIKHRVSAHVLPGLTNADGKPLFILVGGDAAKVKAAVLDYLKENKDGEPASKTAVLRALRKTPVAQ